MTLQCPLTCKDVANFFQFSLINQLQHYTLDSLPHLKKCMICDKVVPFFLV